MNNRSHITLEDDGLENKARIDTILRVHLSYCRHVGKPAYTQMDVLCGELFCFLFQGRHPELAFLAAAGGGSAVPLQETLPAFVWIFICCASPSATCTWCGLSWGNLRTKDRQMGRLFRQKMGQIVQRKRGGTCGFPVLLNYTSQHLLPLLMPARTAGSCSSAII